MIGTYGTSARDGLGATDAGTVRLLMSDAPPDLVEVGRISGVYGVQGWVKVFSYTEPRENILAYSPWYVHAGGQWRSLEVAEGRGHGKGIIARLAGCEDRDAASLLAGAKIAVAREQLPPAEAGEYYWVDLEGLKVVTLSGIELGVVDHLFETGSNDVLVVKGDRERLIPFIRGDVVVQVDLEHRIMRVDWDPEF